MKRFNRAVLIAFALLCQTSLVLADTDVFRFLQEEAKVTTASKREESIQEAPGVITVITADQIKRFGAQNLRDVLDRAPSIYTLSSYLYPSNVVSMRGDLETHVDNHVLWLLNGRPVREPAFGGVNIALLTSFPIDMIDHLEIVRGPGSVLYGSNAYTGVINIITKQAHEKAEAEVKTGGGSFNTSSAGATAAIPAKDGGVEGSVQFNRSGGWLSSARDEKRIAGSAPMKDEETSFALASSFKDWTLSGFYANTHNVDLGITPTWSSVAPTNTMKGMFDLGYKHAISDDWSLGLNETFNRTQLDVLGATGDAARDGTSILTEATLYGKPLHDLNIVVGGTGDYQEADFDPEGVQPNQTWWSFYSQADYRLNSFLKLTGGMQYNKPKGISAKVSPRGGLVATLNPEWGAKLLYGEAFRAPYLGETQFNTVNLRSNPDLRPETIRTYETQLFHQSAKDQSSLTFFHSEQRDRIGRVVVSGLPTLENVGSLTSQGIELENTLEATARLSFTGSYTYQVNWDQNNVHDATFMPNNMLKTGVSYVADRGITVGLFNTFFGERGDVNAISPAALEINPPSRSYNWLTAHITFDLYKLSNMPMYSGTTLSLYADNLLNAQVFDPEFNRRVINTLPAQPGRSLYGEFRLKFL